MTEHVRTVDCFGGQVSVRAAGTSASGLEPPAALVIAEAVLLRIHAQLTCFDPDSALSRLNEDTGPVVLAGPLVRRLVASVAPAGRLSGGLVDATLGGDWRSVSARPDAVIRSPGVRLDSGGLAKGIAADLVAARLASHESFSVDCLGDLRVGGTVGRLRPVRVVDPFGGDEPVVTVRVRDAGVATSGTTRRSGCLLDPRTGEPADTGVVQATAFAPTGLEAEVRAKAALLAGPDGAAPHLPHGGVLVLASGAVVELPAA